MRTFKNGEIYETQGALQELINRKFPAKTSFKLAMLAQEIDKCVKAVDVVKTELFKTYGVPNKDNPNMYEVQPESDKFPVFIQELNSLMEQEVSISIDEKIIIPDMVNLKCKGCGEILELPLHIEPIVLIALKEFIELKED